MNKALWYGVLSILVSNVFSLDVSIDIHRIDRGIEVSDCIKNIHKNFDDDDIILDNLIKISRMPSSLQITFISDRPLRSFEIISQIPLSLCGMVGETARVNCPTIHFLEKNIVTNFEIKSGRLINQGYLQAEVVQCKTREFHNESEAVLNAINLEVKLNGLGYLVNDGLIQVNEFSFLSDITELVQNGKLGIFGTLRLDGHLHSKGITEISNLDMPDLSSQRIKRYIRASNGKLFIENANFQVTSFHIGRDADVAIEKLVGTVETCGNHGGSLQIGEVKLVPDIMLYSALGATTLIESVKSKCTIISKGAYLKLGRAKEIPLLSVTHDSKIVVGEAGTVDYSFLSKSSKVVTKKSLVKETYILDSSVAEFENAHVDFIRNSAEARFRSSFVRKAENFSDIVCEEGETIIDTYDRKPNSRLLVTGTEGKPLIRSEDAPYIVQHLGTTVYMQSIRGEGGRIEGKNIFFRGFVPGCSLNGNISVYLDYMPDKIEFPEYEGQLKLCVDLSTDFKNTKDTVSEVNREKLI